MHTYIDPVSTTQMYRHIPDLLPYIEECLGLGWFTRNSILGSLHPWAFGSETAAVKEFALAAEKPVPHVLRPGEAPSLPWEVGPKGRVELERREASVAQLRWFKRNVGPFRSNWKS